MILLRLLYRLLSMILIECCEPSNFYSCSVCVFQLSGTFAFPFPFFIPQFNLIYYYIVRSTAFFCKTSLTGTRNDTGCEKFTFNLTIIYTSFVSQIRKCMSCLFVYSSVVVFFFFFHTRWLMSSSILPHFLIFRTENCSTNMSNTACGLASNAFNTHTHIPD